ncbi:tyrosine-type recombinase/integrase [Lysinibacillus fusiformis]
MQLPIHSTRHTHTVMLMEAEWEMKSISESLGYESIVTTMNAYAHISHNFAKQSIDSFDEYMER